MRPNQTGAGGAMAVEPVPIAATWQPTSLSDGQNDHFKNSDHVADWTCTNNRGTRRIANSPPPPPLLSLRLEINSRAFAPPLIRGPLATLLDIESEWLLWLLNFKIKSKLFLNRFSELFLQIWTKSFSKEKIIICKQMEKRMDSWPSATLLDIESPNYSYNL